MNPTRYVQRGLLFVGLGVLPLLLPMWMRWSGMAHGPWFYLLALMIAAAGLTASLQLVRVRRQERPARSRTQPRLHSGLSGEQTSSGTPPYTVLLSVALPSSGVELLRLARALAPSEQLHLAALHLWPEDEFRKQAFERWRDPADDEVPNPLRPMLEEAGGLQVDPLCLVSTDVGADINAVAEEKQADLVLLGWHAPVLQSEGQHGPAQTVLQQAPCDVAVYLARRFRPPRRVLVPYAGGLHDRTALELARRLGTHGGASVTILHVVPPGRGEESPRMGLSRIVEDIAVQQVRLKVIEHENPVEAAVQEAWMGYDLIVAGASETWGLEPSLFAERHERLAFATPASLLIVRAGRGTSSARGTSPLSRSAA